MRTCTECGTPLMTRHSWSKLDADEKAQLRAQGFTRHEGRGLCGPCAYVDPTPPAQRASRPVAHVAEDWADLVDNRLTQKENVRNLAPRLGMTEGALERAVLRAKRRGLLGVAA